MISVIPRIGTYLYTNTFPLSYTNICSYFKTTVMIISLYNGFLKRVLSLIGKHAFVPLFLIFCVIITLPTYASEQSPHKNYL